MKAAWAAVGLGILTVLSAYQPSAATPTGRLPASVTSLGVSAETKTYPVTQADGTPLGTAQWRVISGTGNCCENYLSATSSGRLIDFGGNYINYSDDKGLSWRSVRPNLPFWAGEGAVAVAPGGDVLGVGWDSVGDRIVAYKYRAASGAWEYQEASLHSPFADRPWLAVVKGPFTVGGTTVPYISILVAGAGSNEIWYYSLDGLTYLVPDSTHSGTGTVVKWLTPRSDAEADWLQPQTDSQIGPLSGGGAISRRELNFTSIQTGDQWAIMEPDVLRWSSFALPSGQIPGARVLSDSQGRLHAMLPASRSRFEYRVSSDGGQSWRLGIIDLPPGMEWWDYDFRTNATLGVTALAVHALEVADNHHQDLVFRVTDLGGTPRVDRVFHLGLGDRSFGSNALSTGERMDFTTVALLPDGTIATSLSDSQHLNPSVAVLLGVNQVATSPSPSTTFSAGPNPTPTPTASASESPTPSASPPNDPTTPAPSAGPTFTASESPSPSAAASQPADEKTSSEPPPPPPEPGSTPGGSPSAQPTPVGSASAGSGSPSTADGPPPGNASNEGSGGGAYSAVIERDKTKASYMGGFRLFGRVQAVGGCSVLPSKVDIKGRAYGSDVLERVASVPVAGDGTWSLDHRASVSTSYVAIAASDDCGTTSSSPIDVLVRAGLQMDAMHGCRSHPTVTGKVLPSYPGTIVKLERKTVRGWTFVDRDRLSARSSFSLVAETCRAPHRVRWPRQDLKNLGVSQRV